MQRRRGAGRRICYGNQKEREQWEDYYVDGTKILKWILDQ
jgi:hypothetical protein